MKHLLYLLFITSFILPSCKQEATSVATSSISHLRRLDAKQTGVDFTNTLEEGNELNIIEYLYYYNGGGVAIGDINNDGLEDLFFTSNQGSDKLYLNKGDLIFEDITQMAGIYMDDSWSSGVVMDDINNDGLLDIFVCKVGVLEGVEAHNLCYLNNGDGTFKESAKALGLDFSGYSTQACFLDYDKDGDLDMYLLNHSVHSVRSYGKVDKRKEKDPIAGDRFYENRINEGGGFVEVTEAVGIYSSPLGYGLAVSAADINQDGWTDLYIGNDFHENDYLYINNKGKGFVESIATYTAHTSQFSMGVDIADINLDGKPDIFTTDMMPSEASVVLKSGGEDTDQIKRIKKDLGYERQLARNHLMLQEEDGAFADMAYRTQTYATDWSWSVLLQDFDNNGQKDIFISNGIVRRPNDLDYINYLNEYYKVNQSKEAIDYGALLAHMPSQPLQNVLFSQRGSMDFSEYSSSLLGEKSFSNGAAYADLDKDGDLEIVCNNINQEAFIYENLSSDKGNYLQITLRDTSQTKTLKGSQLVLYVNGQSFSQEYQTVRGFQSSSTHSLFFGLDSINLVDSIEVIWPDRTREVQYNVAVNQELTIYKENATPLLAEAVDRTSARLFALPIEHKENRYFDDEYEKLIPERLSAEGPALLVEDLDGDGIMDIYLGGGRGQAAKLLLGATDGSFTNAKVPSFSGDARYEDVAAALIDFDKDGDKDIYVVSGGNDELELNKLLEDRLYLNNGGGDFRRIPLSLPHTNGSCVTVGDFDQDGYEDLFIGARSIPGSYGLSPYSFVLRNNEGKGLEIAYKERYGMVTEGHWVDLDQDGDVDLVMCGDWMPIRVFENKKGALSEVTDSLGLDHSSGMWNALDFYDFNDDGQLDIVAGNAGLNHKWQPTKENPVKMYLGDFDQNGSSDPIIMAPYFGRYLPFASLDKLTSQLPFLKKKFTTYASYSEVEDIEDLLDNMDLLVESRIIEEMKTCVFLSGQGTYEMLPLNAEAQSSDVKDVFVEEGTIYYVGNNKEYVAHLGASLSNPGGMISQFDRASKSFKRSILLGLNQDSNNRVIARLSDNQLLIASNDSYVYILAQE